MVTSRFLCTILRHKPENIGLELDKQGYVLVKDLLRQLKANKLETTFEELETLVRENNKKRFSFSKDKTKIRACQGHSIPVDLSLEAVEPPDLLYHGTVYKFIKSILKGGLEKMSRQYVHLSKDTETAKSVGSRRGTPVILNIDAKSMYEDGYNFYCSENGVWLTDHVPAKYIKK